MDEIIILQYREPLAFFDAQAMLFKNIWCCVKHILSISRKRHKAHQEKCCDPAVLVETNIATVYWMGIVPVPDIQCYGTTFTGAYTS